MAAKIDKVEVYSKGPPSIESFDLWSCDQVITWQMENVISQLLQDLWLSNLTYIKSDNLFITWSYKVTWQMKNVIKLLSRDLQLPNLTEGWFIRSHVFNHKATYFFDHVVTWVHVTNELCYIFTSTRPIATKFNRVIACNEESPLTK